MTDFHGYPTATLENEVLRLEYLIAAGLRIVGLSYKGSPNLFADAYDIATDTPLGKYFFRGGHRLWISPESIEKTYIPDHTGLEIKELPNGIRLTGAREPVSGVRKSLLVEMAPGRAAARLTHIITNENTAPILLAPWAISMFRQGGTAILPQPVGNTDPNGLLPNRLLELWPYTRLQDGRLVLRDDFILVHARSELPPLKLGYMNTAGWLAYWLEGVLFRKSFDLHPGASYPDGGCNAEIYCGNRFIELESLGPLGTLAPGAEVQLIEIWELFDTLHVPFLPQEIRELAKE